jgi:hypothetical protein
MNRSRALLAVGFSAALVAPGSTASAKERLVVVEQAVHPLVFHETAETLIPLPFFPLVQEQHGASLLLNSVVRADSQVGPEIGVMHGQCTTIGSSESAVGENQDPATFMMQCTHTLRIDGRGSLVLTGLTNSREFEGTVEQCYTDGVAQVLAITGGTGDFKRARGDAEVSALPNHPGCGFVGCPNAPSCQPGQWKQIVLTIR